MKLVHLFGFIIKKFVTIHGHVNVKVCGCVSAGALEHLRDMTKFSAHVMSLDDKYML